MLPVRRTLAPLIVLAVAAATLAGCGRSEAGPPETGAPGATTACPTTPTVRVSDAAELTTALRAATPGATVELMPGRYAGTFSATASGTAAAPITLCGSARAVLDGGDVSHGYALHLDHASYWRVTGLTLTDAQKGLVIDAGEHDVVDGLTVTHVGDEGIHLRTGSSEDTVRDSTVSSTGLLDPTYGEGIYVGSAQSNWCAVSGCAPDRSDDDLLVGNRISGTTAEAIDIKEGTTGTAIRGNTLSGDGGVVDSVVNLKGNEAVVAGNTITANGRDGVQIHTVVAGWGARNQVRPNTFVLSGSADAVRVDGAAEHAGNEVSCGQKVRGGGWRGAVSSVGCH